MSDTTNERIWGRVQEGRHCAVIGATWAMGAAPAGLRALRARCDGPPSTLGPILEVRRQVGELLDEPAGASGEERRGVGILRRFVREAPGGGAEAELAAAVRRLVAAGVRPALVFEAVDAADPVTLEALRQLVLRPGWLGAPLVLGFRSARPSGAAGELLAALRRAEGAAAVVEVEAPGGGEAGEAGGGAGALAWRALPAEVIEVLRAGALIGAEFEVELAAGLLEIPTIAALGRLQAAADAGVAVRDRGDGRVGLPAALAEEARASLLPSLASAWHRRLAALLADERAEEAAAASSSASSAASSAASSSASSSASSLASPPVVPDEPVDAIEVEPYVAVFAASEAEEQAPASEGAAGGGEEAPTGAGGGAAAVAAGAGAGGAASVEVSAGAGHHEVLEGTGSGVGSRRRRRPRRDPARAASHLSAAGEEDAAALRFVEAARVAAAEGASGQAVAHARRALALLGGLPATPRRRALMAEALVEVGRAQWRGIGADGAYRLDDALATAEAAKRALPAEAPARLHAEVSLLIAEVCHDRGDLRALERALAELTEASRRLMAAGEALAAAALLNNQAAIYLRLGDPVRATHLLLQSRGVFEGRARDDAEARRELAETHHLLARVPLRARLRPGREGDAMTMGLDHALIAERTFRELGMRHELARVWETMGRLELRKGRRERAAERLTAALGLQRELGDVVGLARTTAAFADLLAGRGELREALGLLSSSITLNREKGSPLGLAFNRAALAAIAPLCDAEGRAVAAGVERELAAAEALLGRHPLPPSVEAAGS